MKNMFPLGTIVLLKDSTRRLMIYGRLQKQDHNEKIWDYIGCCYPEGSLDTQNNYLFDEEQIEKVYYIGFQDYEELNYRKLVIEKSEELAK